MINKNVDIYDKWVLKDTTISIGFVVSDSGVYISAVYSKKIN